MRKNKQTCKTKGIVRDKMKQFHNINTKLANKRSAIYKYKNMRGKWSAVQTCIKIFSFHSEMRDTLSFIPFLKLNIYNVSLQHVSFVAMILYAFKVTCFERRLLCLVLFFPDCRHYQNQ